MEGLLDKAPRDILVKHLYKREVFGFLDESFDASDIDSIPYIVSSLAKVSLGLYEFLEEVFNESSISDGLQGLDKGFANLKINVDEIKSSIKNIERKLKIMEENQLSNMKETQEAEHCPGIYETTLAHKPLDRKGVYLYVLKGCIEMRVLSDMKPFGCEGGDFLTCKYSDKFELIFTNLGQVMGYIEIETDKGLTVGNLIHFLKEKYKFEKFFII